MILMNKNLQLDKFPLIRQVFKYYFMDENEKIYNPNPCSNIILNPFRLNWHFLDHNYSHKYLKKKQSKEEVEKKKTKKKRNKDV